MRLVHVLAVIAAFGLSAAAPQVASAQIALSITLDPPALPVYVPPPPPAPSYIWTPGYWGYGPYGYYWVPGTWVMAPAAGLLWTPGYWGWSGGYYHWNEGYWGPHVGYYGGIHYGYGYDGVGFNGGHWDHGHYFGRPVSQLSMGDNPVSFNGGPRGLQVQPTAQQMAFAHEHHVPPTPMQQQHVRMALQNPDLRASANHGRPPIAATARPGVFSGHGVVEARAAGGPVMARPAAVNHPAAARPAGSHNLSPQVDRNMRNAPSYRPNPQAQHEEAPRAPQAAHPAEPLQARSPYTVRNATVGGYRPQAPHPAPHPEQEHPHEGGGERHEEH